MANELAKADTLRPERCVLIRAQFGMTPAQRLESNRIVKATEARTREFAYRLGECDLTEHPMARAIAEIVGNSIFRHTNYDRGAPGEEDFLTAYPPRNFYVRPADAGDRKVFINMGLYQQTLHLSRAVDSSTTLVRNNRSYARPLQMEQLRASLGMQPGQTTPLTRQLEAHALPYKVDVDWEMAQARYDKLGHPALSRILVLAVKEADIDGHLPWHYAPVFNRIVTTAHRGGAPIKYPINEIETEIAQQILQASTAAPSGDIHDVSKYREKPDAYAAAFDAMDLDDADLAAAEADVQPLI